MFTCPRLGNFVPKYLLNFKSFGIICNTKCLRQRVVSPSFNPEATEQPLIDYQRLLIEYIRRCRPYQGTILFIRKLKTSHANVTETRVSRDGFSQSRTSQHAYFVLTRFARQSVPYDLQKHEGSHFENERAVVLKTRLLGYNDVSISKELLKLTGCCCLHIQITSKDKGIKIVRNVGNNLPVEKSNVLKDLNLQQIQVL